MISVGKFTVNILLFQKPCDLKAVITKALGSYDYLQLFAVSNVKAKLLDPLFCFGYA